MCICSIFPQISQEIEQWHERLFLTDNFIQKVIDSIRSVHKKSPRSEKLFQSGFCAEHSAGCDGRITPESRLELYRWRRHNLYIVRLSFGYSHILALILQDIGLRSFSFLIEKCSASESCFKNGLSIT
jgi:hypothetical protein